MKLQAIVHSALVLPTCGVWMYFEARHHTSNCIRGRQLFRDFVEQYRVFHVARRPETVVQHSIISSPLRGSPCFDRRWPITSQSTRGPPVSDAILTVAAPYRAPSPRTQQVLFPSAVDYSVTAQQEVRSLPCQSIEERLSVCSSPGATFRHGTR